MENNSKYRSIVCAIIGAISAVTICVIVYVLCGKCYEYRPIVITNQNIIQDSIVTQMSKEELFVTKSLKNKGVLLTPNEYTNYLLGYYNTLLSFLAIVFIIFSLIGYIYVKNMTKKEVREEANEILSDSESFRKNILDTIRGEFDGNYVSKEDFESEIEEIKDKIESIANATESSSLLVNTKN